MPDESCGEGRRHARCLEENSAPKGGWKLDSVVLMSPGIGRAFRGYERFSTELYAVMHESVETLLMRGAGPPRRGEVTVGGLSRDGWMARFLGRLRWDRFAWEALSFGIKAWARLGTRRLQVIHYSEPILNNLFSRLERVWPRPVRRVFSHGLNMDPEHTLRCHHLHQVSLVAYERALELGVSETRMSLIPHGVRSEALIPRSNEERRELRARYALPSEIPLVLCVAAVNSRHKRIPVLLEACAGVREDFLLLLCGPAEEPEWIARGHALLGERFRHLYVPPGEMANVYAMADQFVLPSLIEGFGLAVVEAALAGLPVLVHDSRHFRWLLGPHWDGFVDMRKPENLREALQWSLERLPDLRRRMASLREEWVSRYDWLALAPKYLEMFARAAEAPGATIAMELGYS